MTNARLIVQSDPGSGANSGDNSAEYEITNTISVGGAPDNDIHLRGQNIAPYQAIIVKVNDSYLISDIGDLKSFVNGERIHKNHQLRDGDQISIGDAAIRFLRPSQKLESSEGESNPGNLTSQYPNASQGKSAETFSWLQIALAFTIGLSMVGVVALGYYMFRSNGRNGGGGNCGLARITSPLPGTIVSRATTISVSIERPDCARRISYLLDGQPFASSGEGVFEAVLDPINLARRSPELSGGKHELSVVVEGGGQSSMESEGVEITLEATSAAGVDIGFIREKAEALAGLLSGSSGGDFVFDPEFLERIGRQTSEFRGDFYSAAEQHKFEINPAFRNDAGLSEMFGYLLAISRSRFVAGSGVNGCGVDPDGVGLWRLPQRVIRQYPNKCGGSNQDVCIAANHFNELLGVFDGPEGFMFAVACFGESSDRAGQILEHLSDANLRRNFWASARAGSMTQDEIGRVICFMAAGVVAQNPKSFGINSQSLSSRVK